MGIMEIERKFLVRDELPLEFLKDYISTTVYVCADIPEVRVRKYVSGDHEDYLLTVKGAGDLERKEVETYVSAEFYAGLVDVVGKTPIIKHGKIYKLEGGLKLEYAIVDIGRPTGFGFAEIEFKTKEQALQFIAPNYLGEEVTFNPRYKIRNYWLETRG